MLMKKRRAVKCEICGEFCREGGVEVIEELCDFRFCYSQVCFAHIGEWLKRTLDEDGKTTAERNDIRRQERVDQKRKGLSHERRR